MTKKKNNLEGLKKGLSWVRQPNRACLCGIYSHFKQVLSSCLTTCTTEIDIQ